MAHTEVFISNDAGTLVPSQPSVAISNGDTLAFSLSNAGPVFAFFSPDATAALSPAPNGPVSLGSKGPTVFTFTTSDPGAYSVYFEATASAAIPDFPGGTSNLLHLEIDTDGAGESEGPGFGGITNHSRGG
ncbi:cupredoxin domain-containing protein [Granulicella aggregans]|jgi:hypothetical protein|uniref:hypothetical protein n=1 Tax=Granulicella aggregans TaxID=474949 RepID=UPI0021E05456|nr:hypothetical protein [Granulicella aggregans]